MYVKGVPVNFLLEAKLLCVAGPKVACREICRLSVKIYFVPRASLPDDRVYRTHAREAKDSILRSWPASHIDVVITIDDYTLPEFRPRRSRLGTRQRREYRKVIR